MYWRLNRIQYPIYNLGPGRRIGIWVQGCSLRCRGCINQSLWTKKNGKNIDILRLAHYLSEIKQYFDGITITGGEPFDQYESLVTFCALIKQIVGLDVYCFTGYTLEELMDLYPDQLFVKYLDFLMDGRYVRDKHDNQNVRGSTNQKLYMLKNGRPELQENMFSSRAWSLAVSKDNQVFMSGIPKKEDLETITRLFTRIGIEMRFK